MITRDEIIINYAYIAISLSLAIIIGYCIYWIYKLIEPREKFFYCQASLEDRFDCKKQCQHCKIYYASV